jgi:hypothetical protein
MSLSSELFRAMARRNWIVAVAAGAVLIACGGGSAASGGSTAARASSSGAPSGAGARVAPRTGGRMCDALTAADLVTVGLHPKLQQPEVNPDDPPDSGAYCLFKGAAGAANGIEFDIFYPADHSVYQTVVAEGGGSVSRQPTGLSGIDESAIQDMSNDAGINVRRGTLVFAITVPSGPRSHTSWSASRRSSWAAPADRRRIDHRPPVCEPIAGL